MATNSNVTELDYAQVLQREFQVDSDAIRTYPAVGYNSNTDAIKVEEVAGNILAGVEFDSIAVAYPNNHTEVYTYYTGGLSGALKATVTVIYTDSTKDDIASIVRT